MIVLEYLGSFYSYFMREAEIILFFFFCIQHSMAGHFYDLKLSNARGACEYNLAFYSTINQ